MSRSADVERMYCIYNRPAPRCPNWYRERSQKPPSFGTCGFESHPRHLRRSDDVRLAILLVESGFNPSQVARHTGIPRSTIRGWVAQGSPVPKQIQPDSIPSAPYAYLLGLYLGDGYICRTGRSYRLRIAMDSRYPGIIEEARSAIEAVLAPNKGSVQRFRERTRTWSRSTGTRTRSRPSFRKLARGRSTPARFGSSHGRVRSSTSILGSSFAA